MIICGLNLHKTLILVGLFAVFCVSASKILSSTALSSLSDFSRGFPDSLEMGGERAPKPSFYTLVVVVTTNSLKLLWAGIIY